MAGGWICRRSPGSVFILFLFCTVGPGGSPEKMPENLISVFIITAQGRRLGSAGAPGWSAPVPRAKNFIHELRAERMPGGGGAGAGKLQPFPG